MYVAQGTAAYYFSLSFLLSPPTHHFSYLFLYCAANQMEDLSVFHFIMHFNDKHLHT
jgi:hypothetical protein